MKLIIAIVQSDKLEAVETALNPNRHACLMSISEALGTSRESGDKESYRGREVFRRRHKFRLEIAVNDQAVETTLDAVVRAGSREASGGMSDCKAFVLDLPESALLRTGE